MLDAFITIKINEEFVPAIDRQLPAGNLKLYFDEVLIGTLIYTKDVTFHTVLDWDKRPVDRAAFTEALSAVMTMLLGRSLVLVADGFMAALQANMKRACEHAANRIDATPDPFSAMGVSASPELKSLLAEVLRVGGEVFGPLPDDARRNLRLVLYDVMETLPPDAAQQAGFVENLSDQFFIPNQQSVEDLSDQLLAICRERFQLFVERVLEAGGNFVLDAIEDLIRDVIKTVLQWVKDLEGAIKVLFGDIAELNRAIQELIAQAQQAFDQATQKLEILLERFSNRDLRTDLRRELAKKFFREAKAILSAIPLYRSLPRAAKHAVKELLKDVVAGAIEGPVLDPIFDEIGALAGELDSLLDDVRELNPNEPLAPQLLDLVVDRLEDRIKDAFGGSNPRVDVGFTVAVFGVSHHFNLGAIDLPFSKLFTILRDAINVLDFYEDELQAAAAALADAFRKAVDLDAKRDLRDRKRADHDRLSRIRDEFTSDPKSITVISPAQSLVYDDDVDVQIELGGVPASYLGLTRDEQQRVLVFLNGALIPPQALAIDGSSAAPSSGTLPERLNPRASAGFEPAGPPGMAPTALPQFSDPAARARAMPDNALRLQPALRSLAVGRGKNSSRPAARQSVKQSAGGITVVTTKVTNVLPGRRMTATKRASLEQTLPAGTTIAFRADRANLVTGTNTLVVVVIDPAGQRYQQAVSFGVTAAATSPRGGVRLPTTPGRKPAGKPTSMPSGIDLHFDNKMLGERLTKSRDFIARHSAPHVQEFRRREPSGQ